MELERVMETTVIVARGVDRDQPHKIDRYHTKAYAQGHADDCWCRPWRQLR